MGWSSGTEIAVEIEELLLKYVPTDKLEEAAEKMLKALSAMDWDCQDEVEIFDYLNKKDMLDCMVNRESDYYSDDEIEAVKVDLKKYKEKFKF